MKDERLSTSPELTEMRVAVVGPRGSGKTTLVHALMDSSPPESVAPTHLRQLHFRTVQTESQSLRLTVWDVPPDDQSFFEELLHSMRVLLFLINPTEKYAFPLIDIFNQYRKYVQRMSPESLKLLLLFVPRSQPRYSESPSFQKLVDLGTGCGMQVLETDCRAQSSVNRILGAIVEHALKREESAAKCCLLCPFG